MSKHTPHHDRETQELFTLTAIQKLRAGEPINPKSCTAAHFGKYLALVEDMRLFLVNILTNDEDEATRRNHMALYWSTLRHDKQWAALVRRLDAIEINDAAQDLERDSSDSPASEVKPLAPYTLKDLMARHFPARRWAVRPFFPEGLIVLAGTPGIGKSYFALNLAIAVASGGNAFGALKTDQAEVLYLSFEDDPQAMQERIDTVWEDDGQPYPDGLYIQHEDVPKLGQGLVDTLSKWMDDHPQTGLIIIDVLGDVKPPRQSGSDWYLDDKALLTPLRRLANSRHVAMMLLHHTNRRENPDNPFEMIHGGAGIEGTPDTKAVLMRGMGKSDAIMAIRGRNGVIEQRAAFSYQDGRWTYLGAAEDFSRTQERQDIITFLRKTPDPVRPKHVAVMLGRDEGNTRKLMRTMARQGDLKVTGYGLYTVNTSHSGHSHDTHDTGNSGNSATESTAYETPTHW